MNTFNLLDEPWIPCVGSGGERVELGIRDTILRAHEFQEIYDASPVVTASLHRLLLAILHRVFDVTTSLKTWPALWESGQVDAVRLDAYLGDWTQRFDLLHPERPFYQNRDPDTLAAAPRSAGALLHELASGNNETLFEHGLVKSLTHAEAARALVATQMFALGGGVSKPFNLSHAPLIAGAVIQPRGENLFQTLMLCLTPAGPTIPQMAGDLPAWEPDKTLKPKHRPPKGYLDYLTWQSRRVLLVSEGGVITGARVLQGDAVKTDRLEDPFMAFKESKEHGMLPLRFRQERAVWRDAHVLLAHETGDQQIAYQRSKNLSDVAKHLDYPPALQLDIFGLCSDKAKVNFWRHERLPLPSEYLRDTACAAALNELMRNAEETATALRHALQTFAENLLASKVGGGMGKADPKNVKALAEGLGALPHFWAAVQPDFYRAYEALPGVNTDDVRAEWRARLRQHATDALRVAASGHDNTGRGLRAWNEAARKLNGRLNKTLPKTEKEVSAS